MIWTELKKQIQSAIVDLTATLELLRHRFYIGIGLMIMLVASASFLIRAESDTLPSAFLRFLIGMLIMYVGVAFLLWSATGSRFELAIGLLLMGVYLTLDGRYALEVGIILVVATTVLYMLWILIAVFYEVRFLRWRDKTRHILMTHLNHEPPLEVICVGVSSSRKDFVAEDTAMVINAQAHQQLDEFLTSQSLDVPHASKLSWEIICTGNKEGYLILTVTPEGIKRFQLALFLGSPPYRKNAGHHRQANPAFLGALDKTRQLMLFNVKSIAKNVGTFGFTGHGGGTLRNNLEVDTGLQLTVPELPAWHHFYKKWHVGGATWLERYHDPVLEVDSTTM